MKSIKPGRGPSFMGAAGSVFVAIFGVIWTIAAVGMGAPFFFPLFGIAFVGFAIFQGIYHYKNATGENRYSEYDIVDEYEEPDPLNRRFGSQDDGHAEDTREPQSDAFAFCPYCGAEVEPDFTFCARCGKQLPNSQ